MGHGFNTERYWDARLGCYVWGSRPKWWDEERERKGRGITHGRSTGYTIIDIETEDEPEPRSAEPQPEPEPDLVFIEPKPHRRTEHTSYAYTKPWEKLNTDIWFNTFMFLVRFYYSPYWSTETVWKTEESTCSWQNNKAGVNGKTYKYGRGDGDYENDSDICGV